MLSFALIAFAVAAALGLTAWATKSRTPLVPAALWLAYAVYETLILRRVLCSGECNIRIDLLLLYPLLLLATAVPALRWLFRRWRTVRRGP